MAKKKVDPRVAKERKQKKIAAVGSVLLVVVLAVQVPRTMKMLDSGEEAAAAEPVPAATTTAPAPPGATPLDPPTLSGQQPSEAPPAAAPPPEPSAKLVSFSRFTTKDPFAPQVEPGAAASKPAAGPKAEPSAAKEEETEPGGAAGGGDPPDAAPTTAELVVNGTAEAVAVGGAFPAADKAFVLTRLTAKSATVGVADDGSFASGGTLEIGLGESVTLVNTADGTRYVVELRSIA